jgi:uncharacterized membrane protein
LLQGRDRYCALVAIRLCHVILFTTRIYAPDSAEQACRYSRHVVFCMFEWIQWVMLSALTLANLQMTDLASMSVSAHRHER